MRILLSICGAAALVASTPAAANDWTVTEPGAARCNGVEARLTLGPAGEPSLSAARNCADVLKPAPIGIVTTAADFSSGLRFLGRTDRVLPFRYTTVAGKKRLRSGTARVSRFLFAKGDRRFAIAVRAARDGIAYRYEFAGAVTIERELSSFALPAEAPLFLSTYEVKYEKDHFASATGRLPAGEYSFPVLFQAGANWALLSESDVDGRYPGARLVYEPGSGRFRLALADAAVPSAGPMNTPWRTAIIGSLETIVESTLNEDVAPPSRLRDASWVKPGVSGWSWLDGTKKTQTSLVRQKEYVDYTASQGWPYLIVDDGWKTVDWMPELIRYATARGVKIMLWYHYKDVDTDAERAAEFGRIKAWGAAGVKLDFMDSDSRATNQWYDDTLRSLAAHKLLANFHGSTLPHGIQRTWPHVVTMEAVKGEESNRRRLEHILILPFTRNAVGSMDYTSQSYQRERPHSDAAELALAVVYESGMAVFGGSIAAYQARPEAQRFLREVPAAWDDTQLLDGEPGKKVVMARRDGSRWFLGGLAAGDKQTLMFDTDFLGHGRWLIETVRDSDTGMVRSTETIIAGRTIQVPIAANGGFAAIVCRAQQGRSSCTR